MTRFATREAVWRFVEEYAITDRGYKPDPKHFNPTLVILYECHNAVLERWGLASASGKVDMTRLNQFCLKKFGLYDGPIDGTDEIEALQRFAASKGWELATDAHRTMVVLLKECAPYLPPTAPESPLLELLPRIL